jgi:hypothetical protein
MSAQTDCQNGDIIFRKDKIFSKWNSIGVIFIEDSIPMVYYSDGRVNRTTLKNYTTHIKNTKLKELMKRDSLLLRMLKVCSCLQKLKQIPHIVILALFGTFIGKNLVYHYVNVVIKQLEMYTGVIS